MVWGVIYHPEVQKDLDLLGAAAANRMRRDEEVYDAAERRL